MIYVAATVYPKVVEGPASGLATSAIHQPCKDKPWDTLFYYFNLDQDEKDGPRVSTSAALYFFKQL